MEKSSYADRREILLGILYPVAINLGSLLLTYGALSILWIFFAESLWQVPRIIQMSFYFLWPALYIVISISLLHRKKFFEFRKGYIPSFFVGLAAIVILFVFMGYAYYQDTIHYSKDCPKWCKSQFPNNEVRYEDCVRLECRYDFEFF